MNDTMRMARDNCYDFPAILYHGEFQELSAEAKLVYLLLLNLQKNEVYNIWKYLDKNGEMFIDFNLSDISKLLVIAKEDTLELLKELASFKLLTLSLKSTKERARVYLNDLAEVASVEAIDEMCDYESAISDQILE